MITVLLFTVGGFFVGGPLGAVLGLMLALLVHILARV